MAYVHKHRIKQSGKHAERSMINNDQFSRDAF